MASANCAARRVAGRQLYTLHLACLSFAYLVVMTSWNRRSLNHDIRISLTGVGIRLHDESEFFYLGLACVLTRTR
ncbi:hypothetical protein PSAB6_70409 [Paraburkholderia sabiae]|nr:hypothetical protein PSAB6_70409 [Paraburkholderia sabiae]